MRFIKPCKRLIHFENFLNTLPKVRKITCTKSCTTNFESSVTTDDMFVAFQQRCVQTRWMIHKHALAFFFQYGR